MNPLKPLLAALLAPMLAMAGTSAAGASASATAPATTPYAWRQVAIGGGGFVDGIVFQPAVPGLCPHRHGRRLPP
jgi:ABC-type transport system substrate-binding protein